MNAIIIAGPTASGKTRLGIELAKNLGGEIISCDSMQIYKEIPICSAAATREEMQNIPHHLIGIVDFKTPFSVVAWREEAIKACQDIEKREKMPIFVGGTGMYVHSLLYKPTFFAKSDENVRNELNRLSCEELYSRVTALDKDTHINQNDKKRLVRFLEVYSLTGSVPKKDDWKQKNTDISCKLFCISPEREKLYERINARVDQMLEQGLVEEIRALHAQGVSENDQCYKAIGCRQLIDYFENRCTFSEAIEAIKRESRRYAKRQLTWMRGEEDAIWLNTDDPLNEIMGKIQ